MLFPFLLRDLLVTIVMIVTSICFLQLATFLSGFGQREVWLCWSYLALWLTALASWRRALAPRQRCVAVAIVNVLTIGLPALQYLHGEFHDAGKWGLVALSPTWAALSDPIALRPHFWVEIGIMAIAGLALGLWRQDRQDEDAR